MSISVHLDEYPVLVLLFGMDGCGACDEFLPLFRAASARHRSVPAYAIDCERLPDVADRFDVTSTPTIFLLSRGRTLRRFEGAGSLADAEKLFRYAEEIGSREVAAELAGPPGFRRR